MAQTTYDGARCWTVTQLREVGVLVPPQVPDDAWIPRDEVHFEGHNFRLNPFGYVEGKVLVQFRGRFRATRAGTAPPVAAAPAAPTAALEAPAVPAAQASPATAAEAPGPRPDPARPRLPPGMPRPEGQAVPAAQASPALEAEAEAPGPHRVLEWG